MVMLSLSKVEHETAFRKEVKFFSPHHPPVKMGFEAMDMFAAILLTS